MTMLMEPLAPWLRDLNRFITSEGAPAAFVPPADVIATEEGVTVCMDVPGLTRDDLDIELENDTLTVRGERRVPQLLQDSERAWRHVERRFGRFQRTMRVPGGLNPDAVEASLANGVLMLRVPRPASPRPHRVEIRARETGGGGPDIAGTASGEGAGGAPGMGQGGGRSGMGQGEQRTAGDGGQAPAGAQTGAGGEGQAGAP